MELYENKPVLKSTRERLDRLAPGMEGEFRNLAHVIYWAVDAASEDGKATPEIVAACEEFRQEAQKQEGCYGPYCVLSSRVNPAKRVVDLLLQKLGN